MFATDFEVHWTNEAGTGSPRNQYLSLSPAHLKIVIDERSRIDRHGFPTLAHVLQREIRKIDFLTRTVFHTRSVRSLLFRRCVSAADSTGKIQQVSENQDDSRIIFHVPELCELFLKATYRS